MAPAPAETEKHAVTDVSHKHSQSHDCDVVFESMDSFVECVEGVGMQHQFEERLLEQALQQRKIAQEHGMGETEAVLIRLQMLNGETAVGSTLPDLDILNVCGDDDTLHDELCLGMVLPTDTTLPTTKPGNELISIRSLVDDAEEDE